MTFFDLRINRDNFLSQIDIENLLVQMIIAFGIVVYHGLWTPSEGINQRNLKIWADAADIHASAVPKNLGLGFDFWPCSEGNFLTGRP